MSCTTEAIRSKALLSRGYYKRLEEKRSTLQTTGHQCARIEFGFFSHHYSSCQIQSERTWFALLLSRKTLTLQVPPPCLLWAFSLPHLLSFLVLAPKFISPGRPAYDIVPAITTAASPQLQRQHSYCSLPGPQNPVHRHRHGIESRFAL